jgi:hypothetical protein
MVQAANSAKASDDEDGRVSSVLESVLQRSAFCCLPENFLAALLLSEDIDHREAAVKRILDIRRRPVKPPVSTAIPRLNFDAEEWCELIDISVVQYEPACMRNISDEDLEAMERVRLQFQFGETAGTYCGKKCIQKAEEEFQKQARQQMKVFFCAF